MTAEEKNLKEAIEHYIWVKDLPAKIRAAEAKGLRSEANGLWDLLEDHYQGIDEDLSKALRPFDPDHLPELPAEYIEFVRKHWIDKVTAMLDR